MAKVRDEFIRFPTLYCGVVSKIVPCSSIHMRSIRLYEGLDIQLPPQVAIGRTMTQRR